MAATTGNMAMMANTGRNPATTMVKPCGLSVEAPIEIAKKGHPASLRPCLAKAFWRLIRARRIKPEL
jgi:hypothetical protein